MAAIIFTPSVVGLFIAAAFTQGLTGMALARQGFVTPLRERRTCLVVALRDPVSASKLTQPDEQDNELGEVIGAANDFWTDHGVPLGRIPFHANHVIPYVGRRYRL